MPRSFEGGHDASTLRIAIVASRFNDEIVSGLLEGAVECLARHGANADRIDVYRVPGAFEVPSAVARIVDGYDAVVALGCLIRGDTPHFDFISAQTTNELSRIAVDHGKPVAFGVITCNTLDQAIARSTGAGNKGWEAALAAIEMANLYREIEQKQRAMSNEQ